LVFGKQYQNNYEITSLFLVLGADETHCEAGAGQFVGELLHVWNGEMHLCAVPVISGAGTKIF
jgi:hypothetical protein